MIVVPIRTRRGLNNREHHMARHRRVKSERQATRWVLNAVDRPAIPCIALLTRVAPSNGLDDGDNLPSALKSIRDEIAAWLGVDDKRSEVVRYRYAQERGKWSVRIEFLPMEAP